MKKFQLFSRVNNDGRTTVERRSTDGQSKGRYSVGMTKLLFTLFTLLTLGVGQMWAGELTPKGKYFYFKTSDTWAPDARFAVCFQWKDGGGQDDSWFSCYAVGGETDIYYAIAPDKYWDMYFCRMQASNATNTWDNPPCWNTSAKMQYDGTNNYFVKSTGWNGDFTYNSTYVPKVKAVTLSWDVVPSSGSGTELDPYIVPTGTNVTVKATGEAQVADPDATLKYKWDSGSYDTDDDIVLNCSTNNTKYSTTVTCKNYISSSSSETTQSATVWFKAVTAPTISLAVKRSSTTVSNVYSGETLTLVASPSNAGATPNIVYEYSTSSSFPGGSTTEIASTTSTSQSWTVPANTSEATLYVRARVTSSGYECTSSTSTLTAYGKKTIYVRDNNNWGPSNIKIHHWGDENATDWPGTKTGITAIGGQWISVVVYSCYTGFVLNNGTGTNEQDKTVDLLFTGSGCVSDNTYYTMSTNDNSKQTLSSSTAPAKPTVTTSSAGTIRETSAVLGGNVTAAGNDDYTERGYYWSTNSALSSSNLGVGTKEVVSSEVSSSTGAFSNTKSGLTAGTTYYVIAYATNGQGTNYGSVQNFTTLSTYSITVAAGSGGTVSPSSVTAGQYQSSGTITATPGSNFAFVNWTASTNNITIASATSKSTTVTATSTGTVTANFADKWNVKGDQWSSWGAYQGLPNVSSNTFLQSFSLPATTTYHFKVVKRADAGGDDVWYGVDGGKTLTRESNSVTGLEQNGGNDEYITFQTDYAGSYTITYVYNESIGSMQVSVDFPEAYQVHYDVATIGTGAGHSAAITTSVTNNTYYLNSSSVSFTAAAPNTGYTFKGWYNNATGTGDKVTDTDSDGDEKTLTTTVSSSNNQFYAVYEETLHTEPVNVHEYSTGVYGGTVSPASVQAGIATAPEVTATIANNAWHFRYWSLYKVTQKAGETTGTNPTHINATEDGGNLTATFLPRYALQGSRHDEQASGMPGTDNNSKWDDRDADFVVNSYTNTVSDGKRAVELVCTRTLEPNTRYKFEIFDRTSGKTMGHGSGYDDIGANNWPMDVQDRTVFFNTVGRGTYTFTITHLSEDANNYPYVQITAPTSYQLTLGCKYADVDAGLHSGTTGGTVSATATEGGSTASIVNGNYIISGGSIEFTPSPASGYTFGGWYKDASCTNAYTDGSDNATIAGNVLTISSIGANVPVYAKFVETATDVTLANDTHGHVEVSGATVTSTKTGITTSKTITAVPQDAAWHFLNWTVPDGVTRVSGALTDETITIQTTTSGKTVTANFELRYELRGSLNNNDLGNEAGMPGWSTGAPFSGTVTSLGTADGVNLTCTRTLNPNTNYKFVIHDRELNRNMGYDPMGTDIGSSSLVLDHENLDVVFWTAGRGDYTFNITCISNDDNRYPTVKLNRPASYILNLGWGYSQDGGSSFTDGSVGGNVTATATESATTVPITNGQYVASGGRIDLSATAEDGYTFLGYYNGEGYNTRFSTNANWYNENISAATTAYAKFQANAYAITFDATTNGGTLSGSNQNAIYNNTTIASCPVGVKEGYHFKGWYTAATDGELIIDASGNLQPSITVSETVWTDASSKWKKLSGTTVYAQYEKPEISLALSAASVAPGGAVTATATLTPSPEPSVSVCWHLLYNNGSEHAATFTPSSGNTVSFSAPEEGGMYIVACVLRTGSVCGSGEVLDSTTQSFRVAASNNVTIRYRDNSGNSIAPDGSVVIPALESVGVKAPSMIGYSFSGWTLSDVLHNDCADAASCGTNKDSIYISADYDGVLTATYTKKDMIYFNNTVGWQHVYVYFYDNGDYWDHEANKGIGAQYNYAISDHSPHYYHFWGEMTQIAGTNIWYMDYQALAASIDAENAYKINSYTHVAFTKDAQGYTDAEHIGYSYFYATEAAYRTDFAHSKSMYVPLTVNTEEKNVDRDIKTIYYNTGYWMNYPDNSGYSLKIFDNASDGALKKELNFPFSADYKMPMSITTDLEGNKTYGFKIVRADGNEYGNTGTMTNGHSGDGSQGVWEFTYIINRAGLTTSSAGDYTFTLSYGLDLKDKYNYLVGVHYPEATGDFRVQYKDNDHTNWRTSSVILAGTVRDTVSYFVRKNQTPYIRVQKCTATYDEMRDPKTVVEWNNEDEGANIISSLPSAITADGVYNFIFTKSAGALVLEKVEPYKGNFYIRVDGAGSSNWDNFRASDHMLTYSDYAEVNENFTHYFAHWYDCSGGNKNIKFVIANDYSVCVSDTLTRETATGQWEHIADYIDEVGNLSRSANIRFMYNYKTNAVSRAFIDGAYADGGNFLKILAQTSENIYLVPEGEAGDPQTEITFKDNGNWIYEKTVYAQPGARYKLRSLFGVTDGGKHVITQYFKGGEGTTSADSATIIGGTGSTRYKIRLLYDFKTNRVITAYIPSGTIASDMHINADIMFLREHQGDIEEVDFTGTAKIDQIKNIYCGIQFNKWTLNNRSKTGEHPALSPLLSRYERDMFYVSFPFDVKLSDVIGFGNYGQHWIIEYYDGAARAANGFWADTPTFWRFVTPAMKNSFTLKAGTGYIVALDLDELWFTDGEDHSSVWDNTDVVELLFPGSVTSISNTSVTYNMPEHTCTIGPRFEGGDDRTIKDSHWNVMGVPTYHNLEDGVGVTAGNTTWTAAHPNYIYTWNPQDNSLTATAGATYDYKAMHAYIVQYCGNVTFNTSVSPATGSPRRNPEAPKDAEYRLELRQNDKMVDQAFVKLSNDEEVSAGFAFGEDMSKEFNKNKANIYTFIGTEQVAGNTLPMTEQTTVVPVGVKIAADGDYTFSIPDGTNGVGVTLIDTETGVSTPLSALNYTINLSAGTYDNRFVMEISPVQNTATDLEQSPITNHQSPIQKVMIDQILYIVKDGVMYDARGARVQ